MNHPIYNHNNNLRLKRAPVYSMVRLNSSHLRYPTYHMDPMLQISIANFFRNIGSGIRSGVETVGRGIANVATTAVNKIKEYAPTVVAGLVGGVTSVASAIPGVGNLVSIGVNALRELPGASEWIGATPEQVQAELQAHQAETARQHAALQVNLQQEQQLALAKSQAELQALQNQIDTQLQPKIAELQRISSEIVVLEQRLQQLRV